jgi:hypothetical protein
VQTNRAPEFDRSYQFTGSEGTPEGYETMTVRCCATLTCSTETILARYRKPSALTCPVIPAQRHIRR